MNECSVATLAFLISYFWDQEATANKESIYGENETTIYYLYIFFIRLLIVLEIFTCLKYIIASKIKCKLQLQVNRWGTTNTVISYFQTDYTTYLYILSSHDYIIYYSTIHWNCSDT